MSVCAVCGSADFGDPCDGLFFCLECGTQSQDVRVEVSQLEDGGRFTRRLKKKGKSKKAEKLEFSNSDQHALETFQHIMKRQCDALAALGFDQTVKKAARIIWFTYLKHYGYAFRDQTEGSSCSLTGCNQSRYRVSGKLRDLSPTPTARLDREVDVVSHSAEGSLKSRKRCPSSGGTSSDAKRPKTTSSAEDAEYDTFPDDKFLFKSSDDIERGEDVGEGDGSKKMDVSKSVRMMEDISSWEELDKLERTMDCKQLLLFRQSYLSSRSGKPKFVGKGEQWTGQPRVFKLYMTVSILYLALLYTNQSVLPADIVRWVRLEKIPLNTPLEDGARFRNQDNMEVFFTKTLVTTVGIIDNAFKLYHNLPLPPIPSPDPHAVSHIIISKLQLAECFQRLVDRALDTVYLPIGFTHSNRMDSECAAVIIIMLKILYGLDDHMEMEASAESASIKQETAAASEKLTPTNSLHVWVDWVQLYCTHVSKTSDKEIPFNHQQLSTVRNYQSYFQFCKETVFTKCRPVPVRAKSYRELDPAFGKKIAGIFSGSSHSLDHKPTTVPPRDLHNPPSTDNAAGFPRLVHLSRFIQSPKAPCTTYRPLPSSHRYRQELDETQLSHAMRFVLSVLCQLIDVPLQSLYTVLLSVEKAFTKGIVVVLKNLTHDFLQK